MLTAEDIRETMKLDKEQKEANDALEACQIIIDHGLEGWVPRLVFDVDGLRQLAPKSVNRYLAVIVKLVKLTKGGCDRTFSSPCVRRRGFIQPRCPAEASIRIRYTLGIGSPEERTRFIVATSLVTA